MRAVLSNDVHFYVNNRQQTFDSRRQKHVPPAPLWFRRRRVTTAASFTR